MGRKQRFLKLVLSGEVCDGKASFQPLSKKDHISLPRLMKLLHAAAKDTRIRAVLLVVKSLTIGWAQIEEIHRLFDRLRQERKQLVVFLEQASNKTYYLAAAADRVYLPPSASVEFVGLRTESLFFKNLFAYVGVEPQLFNIGAYKSAAEVFQREGMSENSRAMTEAILADIQGRIIDLVAKNRNLLREQVQDWIDHGPYTARAALAAGLIDGISYEDELCLVLEQLFPGVQEVRSVKSKPKDGLLKRMLTFYRPQVALIVAEGLIASGHSRRAPGRSPILGDRTLVSFLRDAARRRRVKAIVLRINSPGGSTLASDLIWREIKLAESKKPVIMSFGNVAASGGYYVATAASRILASPSTLTGSIGVIGGKFNIRELLSKIGITTDAVEKGAHSGYASATRPFSKGEAETIREQMKDFYEELFLPKVAGNRNRSIEEVRRLAEGRVWTGAQAYSNGLIDGLGGLQDAVEMARQLAGLLEKKSRLLTYVQRRSLLDFLPLQLSQSLGQERMLALMPEDLEIS